MKDTMYLFANKDIFAEEQFEKNRVFCSFATAIPSFTLGFTNNVYATPKSLLKNNKLSNNANKVDLVIRKLRSEDKYSEIVLINEDNVKPYYDRIKDLISDEISNALAQYALLNIRS